MRPGAVAAVTFLPSTTARRWLALAATAALLSLGLTWKYSVELGLGWSYGYWSPYFCYDPYDYYGYSCSPWYVPPVYGTNTTLVEVHGADHPSRALLAIAVALVITGYRKHSTLLLNSALVLGAIGLVGFGVGARPGQLAFAVAVGALALALHTDGLLRIGWQRPKQLNNSSAR